MLRTFLTIPNINNILKEIVVYGILSCALAFPLINGTFDLSIESTCALGGTVCALLVTDNGINKDQAKQTGQFKIF